MNKRQLLELLDYCEDEDEIFICDENIKKLNKFFYDGKKIIIDYHFEMEENKILVLKPLCGLSEDSFCGNRDKKDFICNKFGKCGYQDWEKRIRIEESLR